MERSCGSVSLAQYRVLSLVASGDERSSRLAERLAVAKPTVTAVVDGLVERRLLAREAIEGDRRSIRLRLTPAGSAELVTAEDAMARTLDELLATTPNRGELLAGLAAFHEAWIARVGERLGAVES